MVLMESERKNSKIKILIIEDCVEERRKLLNFLSGDPDIEICTFFSSGFDVISGIEFHKPDVVVVDFLATDADKTIVLDKINSSNMENKPRIIVTSSLDNVNVFEKAFSYGIDYYIRKPIIFSLLRDAIILVARGRRTDEINESVKMAQIKTTVRSMGIPVNVLGYKYITESIKHMINSEKVVFLSEVYKIISKDHDTSLECVEVSIRNAIRKAMRLQTEEFKSTFAFCNFRPSNSIFLATLREIVFSNLHK